MINLVKFVLVFIAIFITARVSQAQTVFVFNPEARVSNIGKVKSDLEDYLKSEHLNARAYIFVTPEDLESSVSRLNPDVAVVASYFYGLKLGDYRWRPLLNGYKDGQRNFQKVLVTKMPVSEVAHLKGKSVAAVSLGYTAAFIDSMLPVGLTASDIRMVSTSKDIDAIMALAFEQVEAAIVTEASFNKLKEINPTAVQNLKIFQQLRPISYPKVVAFPQAKNVDEFTRAFKNMNLSSAQSSSFLKYLGITDFRVESN